MNNRVVEGALGEGLMRRVSWRGCGGKGRSETDPHDLVLAKENHDVRSIRPLPSISCVAMEYAGQMTMNRRQHAKRDDVSWSRCLSESQHTINDD